MEDDYSYYCDELWQGVSDENTNHISSSNTEVIANDFLLNSANNMIDLDLESFVSKNEVQSSEDLNKSDDNNNELSIDQELVKMISDYDERLLMSTSSSDSSVPSLGSKTHSLMLPDSISPPLAASSPKRGVNTPDTCSVIRPCPGEASFKIPIFSKPPGVQVKSKKKVKPKKMMHLVSLLKIQKEKSMFGGSLPSEKRLTIGNYFANFCPDETQIRRIDKLPGDGEDILIMNMRTPEPRHKSVFKIDESEREEKKMRERRRRSEISEYR